MSHYPAPLPIVMVSWRDSATTGEAWGKPARIAQVLTIGFLVEQDDLEIVLAAGVGAGEDYSHDDVLASVAIPVGAIEYITTLEVEYGQEQTQPGQAD